MFPIFSAWDCVLPLLSVVSTAIPWHAEGWQLRLLDCSFESRCAVCLVVSDSLRGRSIHAMLTYEGPASLVNLFFTHFLSSPHAQFPTIYSGYAWARSKCTTSWWVECNLSDPWRTNPTNNLNTESFCRVWFTHLRASFFSHYIL